MLVVGLTGGPYCPGWESNWIDHDCAAMVYTVNMAALFVYKLRRQIEMMMLVYILPVLSLLWP